MPLTRILSFPGWFRENPPALPLPTAGGMNKLFLLSVLISVLVLYALGWI
jgi:hypothetical protein